MLFYERENYDYAKLMPNTADKELDPSDDDEELSEYKKSIASCSVM